MPENALDATELPPAIGKTAQRVLALHGYTTFDQLTTIPAADLLAIHGVGPKAIRLLGEHLAERGQAFAEPPVSPATPRTARAQTTVREQT